MTRFAIGMVLGVSACFVAKSNAAAADQPETKDSIVRGLAFLEAKGRIWKEERKCASCHHIPLMIFALREAEQKGFAVNKGWLAEATTWSLTDEQAKVFPGEGDREKNPETVPLAPAYLALGLNPAPGLSDAERIAWERLFQVLTERQAKEGFWSGPGGRLPVMPDRESATALTLLALSRRDGTAETNDVVRDARERAQAWLAQTDDSTETQSKSLRLLLAVETGAPAEQIRGQADALLKLRNPDGGWSQTAGMASDAFATGQALYALGRAGIGKADPAIVQATEFLRKTQKEDGSWPMESRPLPPSNKRANNLDPIVYAGTAWATLGLLSTCEAP